MSYLGGMQFNDVEGATVKKVPEGAKIVDGKKGLWPRVNDFVKIEIPKTEQEEEVQKLLTTLKPVVNKGEAIDRENLQSLLSSSDQMLGQLTTETGADTGALRQWFHAKMQRDLRSSQSNNGPEEYEDQPVQKKAKPSTRVKEKEREAAKRAKERLKKEIRKELQRAERSKQKQQESSSSDEEEIIVPAKKPSRKSKEKDSDTSSEEDVILPVKKAKHEKRPISSSSLSASNRLKKLNAKRVEEASYEQESADSDAEEEETFFTEDVVEAVPRKSKLKKSQKVKKVLESDSDDQISDDSSNEQDMPLKHASKTARKAGAPPVQSTKQSGRSYKQTFCITIGVLFGILLFCGVGFASYKTYASLTSLLQEVRLKNGGGGGEPVVLPTVTAATPFDTPVPTQQDVPVQTTFEQKAWPPIPLDATPVATSAVNFTEYDLIVYGRNFSLLQIATPSFPDTTQLLQQGTNLQNVNMAFWQQHANKIRVMHMILPGQAARDLSETLGLAATLVRYNSEGVEIRVDVNANQNSQFKAPELLAVEMAVAKYLWCSVHYLQGWCPAPAVDTPATEIKPLPNNQCLASLSTLNVWKAMMKSAENDDGTIKITTPIRTRVYIIHTLVASLVACLDAASLQAVVTPSLAIIDSTATPLLYAALTVVQ